MTPVFTYGTLMDPEIMTTVCGEEYIGTKATAHGFRRRRVIDQAFPAIVPKAGETVQGVLHTQVSQTALERLDRFEGALYRRLPIMVTDQAENRIEAQAYILHEDHRHLLSRDPWTMEWFLREGKVRFASRYEGFRTL